MGQIENSLLLDVIVEILGNPRKENLTKSQYSFDCPVCSAEKDMPDGDGKGNFEVNLSKNVYHCWSCGDSEGTHGSLGKLFDKFGNKELVEALYKSLAVSLINQLPAALDILNITHFGLNPVYTNGPSVEPFPV